MFELKYDWSRRFQFEFEWIELTIVDNKLGRNGQLAGDWEGKVGGRIRSSRQSQITKNFLQTFFTQRKNEELFQRRQSQKNHGSMVAIRKVFAKIRKVFAQSSKLSGWQGNCPDGQ